MLKAKAILNAFYERLIFLKPAYVSNVVKTDVDSEQEFPLVALVMGSDIREEFTKEMYQHSLTLYTDIYVRTAKDSLDDQTLDIREQIEIQLLQNPKLDLDYVFKIELQSMDAPDYNGEGVDYSSKVRIEWLVEYFSQHGNPSA